MKVLYLLHSDPDLEFSGVPLMAKQYAKNLEKNGHEAAFLLPGEENKNRHYEIKKKKINKFFWTSIQNWNLKAFEKKPDEFTDKNSKINFKPDIIHILDWINFSPSVLTALKSFNIPIIRHILNFEDYCYFVSPIFFHKDHQICKAPFSEENCSKCIIKNKNRSNFDKLKSILFNEKKQLKIKLQNREIVIKKHFSEYFDHLIFPSKSFADFFFDYYKEKKSHSIVNIGIKKNNIININSFDKIKIIFCGGADFRKGWFVIDKVFKRILKEGITNFELRIYGHKKKTSKSYLSLYENVSFFESYSPENIDEVFTWANIALIPTYFEGYSIIVREFMSRGVIPISTSAFGIPDIIKDNENGFIIEKPLDINLYNILKKILYNKKLLENIKTNLKNVQIASEEREFSNILNIYKSLIKNK